MTTATASTYTITDSKQGYTPISIEIAHGYTYQKPASERAVEISTGRVVDTHIAVKVEEGYVIEAFCTACDAHGTFGQDNRWALNWILMHQTDCQYH